MDLIDFIQRAQRAQQAVDAHAAGTPGLRVVGARSPRDRGMAHGAVHLVTDRAISAGRLRRAPGDALCKPARAFWELSGERSGPATCKRCIEIAGRLRARKEGF